jgi:hypothetical protein
MFACDLKAIAAADRPRYNELVLRIRGSIRERAETPNGYAFQLDSAAVTLAETAEWIGMERLCCPFLTLQLSASGAYAEWRLAITGPLGAKELIAAEFPALG